MGWFSVPIILVFCRTNCTLELKGITLIFADFPNIDLASDILESDDVSAGENVTLQVTLEPKPQRIGVQIRGSKMKVNTPKR